MSKNFRSPYLLLLLLLCIPGRLLLSCSRCSPISLVFNVSSPSLSGFLQTPKFATRVVTLDSVNKITQDMRVKARIAELVIIIWNERASPKQEALMTHAAGYRIYDKRESLQRQTNDSTSPLVCLSFHSLSPPLPPLNNTSCVRSSSLSSSSDLLCVQGRRFHIQVRFQNHYVFALLLLMYIASCGPKKNMSCRML